MKIKPCKCGRTPEIQYQAGIANTLAKLCEIKKAKPYPRYFVSCECGEYTEIRVTGITVEQRDKQKRQLIRYWNALTNKVNAND
jgi:hypothetical protein